MEYKENEENQQVDLDDFDDQLVFKDEVKTSLQINKLQDYSGRPRTKTEFRAKEFLELLKDLDTNKRKRWDTEQNQPN